MKHPFKHKIIVFYCIIFYALMLYKWMNGMFLYQLQPSFFYIRLDIFTWLFMQTGLHQFLLNNKTAWIIADTLFYIMPAVYLLIYNSSKKLALPVAVLMLIVNVYYVQCYTLYPSNSIEGHVAWLLFPVIFLVNNPATFSFLFNALRYYFLYIFFSAAVWKIVQGGIFNPQQMSGVLLYQHNQLLAGSAFYWQSKMYLWLIRHNTISYILYLLAFLAELSFITGFFTRKYDRWLASIFIIFLLMDHLIMRIPYYELLPLLLTLIIKNDKTQKTI